MGMIRIGLLHIPTIDDEASARLRSLLRRLPAAVIVQEEGIGSQRNWIAETLRRWCDEAEIDLILTIGGTGVAPGNSAAESTPEATLEVLDRQMPGLSEAMRAEAQVDLPLAILDRGVAGIRGRTLIVNLPAGEASALFLEAILDALPAAVAALQGDSAPRRGLNADDFAAWLAKDKKA